MNGTIVTSSGLREPSGEGVGGVAAESMSGINVSRIRILSHRDMLLAMALVAAAVAILFDVWQDIFRIGTTDEECSYVLLAPVVIAWLTISRRGQLKGIA